MWAVRRDRAIGIALLLVPVLSVIGFSVGGAVGEYDPFERDDVEPFLLAIRDHKELFGLSVGAEVVSDALLVPLVAALLYLLFRDRAQAVALLGTIGLLVGTVLFLAEDAAIMSLGLLAADFAEHGGPGGIPAGADATLATARFVNLFQAFASLCALTALGLGLASFGALFVWAPVGERNPPRTLGGLILVGGIGYLATWAFILDHTVGGGITLVAELATLVGLGWLGVWFLRQPVQDPESTGLRGDGGPS